MCNETKALILPDRLCYAEFGGNILAFIETAYQIFKRDFVDTKPLFEGKPIALKKFPLVAGRECTFYHITQEGDNEAERDFSIERTECIPFPRPIIDNINHPYLKVWSNIRKGKERILIFHEEESYLVVLEKRDGYTLFWTAYPVTYEHNYRKLMAEYDAYIKSKDRQE